jgi:hypothetical protein
MTSFGLQSHVTRRSLAVNCTFKFRWWNWKYHILNFFFLSSSCRGLLPPILSVTWSTSKNRLHGIRSDEQGGHNPLFIILSLKNTIWTTCNDLSHCIDYKTGTLCLRNIEARSCYHCCSGKEMNITQPVCVFVALDIQHAMRMGHCHLWPAPL